MRTPRRRLIAWTIYLRKPTRQFLPLFGFAMLVVLLGGVAFYTLHDKPMPFSQALWTTFALLNGEPTLDQWPSHWLLELLHYVLPLLGLVVLLDGLVRFSYYALRRDEMSPEWVHAMTLTFKNHVILFGLGKVGFRVLQQLVELKQQVVVIEKDPLCPNFAYAKHHGVPVRVGTHREEGVLGDANVKEAKSIICCTDDDLANLELAIDARKKCPEIRVVLRMYDQELAEKIRDSMGMDLAFSTAALAAPVFATASADPSIINAFFVDERLLVIARLTAKAGSALCGKAVGDLVRSYQMVVVSYRRREGTVFHPPMDVVIEPADILTIECDPRTLNEIHALNR